MKRFVKHFYSFYDEPPIEDKINEYVECNNLTIITISALYGNGVYALFEEKGGAE